MNIWQCNFNSVGLIIECFASNMFTFETTACERDGFILAIEIRKQSAHVQQERDQRVAFKTVSYRELLL